MNKDEFAKQLNARKDEIKELEDLVQRYANKIKSSQPYLAGSMVIAYRSGIIDLLDYLDTKAKEHYTKKRAIEEAVTTARGDL